MRTTDNRIILGSIVALAGIAITVLTVWKPWQQCASTSCFAVPAEVAARIAGYVIALAGSVIAVAGVRATARPRHVRTVASAITILLTLVTLVMIVGNTIALAHEPTREISCLDRLDAAAAWSCGEYFGQRSGSPVRY